MAKLMAVASSRTFSARTIYEDAFQALRAARLHLATLFHASGALWLKLSITILLVAANSRAASLR